MIESHCNPDIALSDAKQQIKPHVLTSILAKLGEKKNSLESIPNKDLQSLILLLRR